MAPIDGFAVKPLLDHRAIVEALRAMIEHAAPDATAARLVRVVEYADAALCSARGPGDPGGSATSVAASVTARNDVSAGLSSSSRTSVHGPDERFAIR
jgi:hypothetical protein